MVISGSVVVKKFKCRRSKFEIEIFIIVTIEYWLYYIIVVIVGYSVKPIAN